MKKKSILTAATIISIASLITFVIFRETRSVQAQDQQPPPVPERISFGIVGITSGQTMRINVTNLLPPPVGDLPPGPVRIVMMFRYANGNLARNARTGEVIRKVVDLESGDSAFLDVDYDKLPPSPIRAQLRAVVVVQPPPTQDTNLLQDGVCVPSVEILNTSTGKTLFMNPAVARGFNPQPDPPAEP